MAANFLVSAGVGSRIIPKAITFYMSVAAGISAATGILHVSTGGPVIETIEPL